MKDICITITLGDRYIIPIMTLEQLPDSAIIHSRMDILSMHRQYWLCMTARSSTIME